MKLYFTIGMAGHIDHGKTTLTKVLTNIDTDRLQAEKERSISIEPGYAPLIQEEDLEVSIVDVPGHEKFIRQMIAGVAGIDAVILVVAAEEGFMPQTTEHLHILHLLGVKRGIIAVTKSDFIDEEMRELIEVDIRDHTDGTFLEESRVIFVDSISEAGIDVLKNEINILLDQTEVRTAGEGFRMPVDQSFSVKGHGTVVRGTIFDGMVKEGESVTLLPQNKIVRIKQLQVHHETRQLSSAGQRTALNLAGISYEEIERGNVLVKGSYPKTKILDISLNTVPLFSHPIKQRTAVKIHIGTSEVYGKIIFFDRNEILPGGKEEILCQLRLDEEVIAERNDRFILRRPSPAETIGGGSVIDPHGVKYRFGEETVDMLGRKKRGTPEERVESELKNNKAMQNEDLTAKVSITNEQLQEVDIKSQKFLVLEDWWMLQKEAEAQEIDLLDKLYLFHEEHPLRQGMNIAELNSMISLPKTMAVLLTQHFEEKGLIERTKEEVYLPGHEPQYPKQWKKRMEQAEQTILNEKLQVKPFQEILDETGIPKEHHLEFKKFLLKEKMLELDEKHIVGKKAVFQAADLLRKNTETAFTLQEAKQTLDLSRKYLVPLLELFDQLGWTKRQEDRRVWKSDF